MDFEEWWSEYERMANTAYSKIDCREAWNHQQKRIDELESQLESEDGYRRQIEVLEWSVGNKNGVIKNLQLVIKDLENKLDIELKHNETLRDMQKAYQIRPRGKSMLAYLPEGYVLVPVEPTEAMIDAWWDTHVDGDTLDEVKAYKAMIQSAQESE